MISFIPVAWGSLLLPFGVAWLIAILVSFLLLLFKRYLPLDRPGPKRVHLKSIPRVGGVALWFSFVVTVGLFLPLSEPLFGFLVATSFISLVGLIDDFSNLPPFYKLISQGLAALMLLPFGIGIHSLTNPLGGVIVLPFFLDLILTVIWVVAVVNALNFLDGLDGLAGSVSLASALILALLSLLVFVAQPQTALLAFILAGGILGFLLFNWHPAKLFMGDVGSHFLGFALAVLAIISGGKIATAALVLGVPLIDFFWSLWRRLRRGASPVKRDLEHLHHRLLRLGLSQREVVAVFVTFSLLLGWLALWGKTGLKLAVLIFLVFLVLLLLAFSESKNLAKKNLK